MRSKVLVYLPSILFSKDTLSFQFKQIKELGFDQIVLDSNFILEYKLFEKWVAQEKLEVFAVVKNDFSDENQSLLLMENLHHINCPYILTDKILNNSDEPYIRKMEDSGLTILVKENNFYKKRNAPQNGEPFVMVNPLSYAENPLQSTVVNENEEEKKALKDFHEKSTYFLIKPSETNSRANYLRHCKDILNRYFFLGIR